MSVENRPLPLTSPIAYRKACTTVQAAMLHGVPFHITSFFFVFGTVWYFNQATAYTTEWIFTDNTSNDVDPGKEVPFGGPDYITYLETLKFPKTAILWDQF